jgi:hypothetical protein
VRTQEIADLDRALATSSGLFLSRGNTPTFTGATRGWNRMTVRTSFPLFVDGFLLAKAWVSRARMRRSTPADGSMTWGT